MPVADALGKLFLFKIYYSKPRIKNEVYQIFSLFYRIKALIILFVIFVLKISPPLHFSFENNTTER